MAGNRKRMRIFVAFSVVAVAVAGGIAWASIPGSDGVISGCYVKDPTSRNYGKLRAIDVENGKTCKSSEASLTWYSKNGADSRFARGNVSLPFGRAAMAQSPDCCPNPNPPTILTIPGFVTVQLADCRAAVSVRLRLINISGADLYVSGYPNFLAPNNFIDIQGYEVSFKGQIAPRDPASPQAVTLTASAFWDGTNSQCAGQAQAIVTG
jgi:hypothetical protein